MAPGSKYELNTPYRGLALLKFAGGQTYPVIIGNKSFSITIGNPAEPPSFANSAENDLLYKALTDNTQIPEQYTFASLLIQTKRLLESSYSIRTVHELKAKKTEFQQFVEDNYQLLQYSNLINRLIDQYFMMHEYVDYRVAGTPATDINKDIKKRSWPVFLPGSTSWLPTFRNRE